MSTHRIVDRIMHVKKTADECGDYPSIPSFDSVIREYGIGRDEAELVIDRLICRGYLVKKTVLFGFICVGYEWSE